MRDYNIMTQGEKLKNIRNKYDLKQEDITGGEITRNLISIIENNKANITEATAKILATNINLICKERNIDFEVTPDYLLEGVIPQSKKVAEEYIQYIKKLEIEEISKIDSILTEIDVFLKTYDTEEKKPNLYIEIALKFKDNNQYVKSNDYSLKAFESSKDLKTTTRALILLTQCNIYLARYEDAIKYNNILLELNNDPQVQYNTKYNLSLCYKKLKKYNESIEVLNSITEKHKDILESSIAEYVDIYLLIGSCLTELNSFNKAINIYKDLLKMAEDKKEKICIMLNLADVYNKTKDSVNLQKINTKILNILNNNPNISKDYESYIYLSLAKNLKSLDQDYNLVKSLLLKALNNFKTGKCPMYYEDIEALLSLLLDIFILNDESEIDFLKNEIFELIKMKMFPKTSSIALKIIRYYNFKGKKEEITDMINYLVS